MIQEVMPGLAIEERDGVTYWHIHRPSILEAMGMEVTPQSEKDCLAAIINYAKAAGHGMPEVRMEPDAPVNN